MSYSVTMTYDDGVTQTHRAAVDLAGECTGAPSSPAPTTAPTPVPDRFLLVGGSQCGTPAGGAFVAWNYHDVGDGHYAERFDVDLLRNSVVVEHHTVDGGDPTSDGAMTTFDIRPGGPADQVEDPWFDRLTLEPASYSLSITVTYEDGATDQHIVTIDLDAECGGVVNRRTDTTVPATAAPTAPGSTTTVPGGTLPATGSSDLTQGIGAVAGLLTTAGVALFAGIRRSRID